MTFLNLSALGFTALAPVIVLRYLRKLKRRPVPVSTLMFWQLVLEENRRRALFGRLRQVWSLLLHLLIFALILLALARPVLRRVVDAGTSTVLILDTRARMGARENAGGTRLQHALREAEARLQQAGPARQIAVLTTAPQPAVAAPFSGDERALRESLASVCGTDAGGELAPALALADTLLASRAGARRIVLITASSDDLAEVRAAHPAAEIVLTGEAQGNVAITRFATRAMPASPETSEVFLEVQNFSTAPARGNVELSLDGPVSLRPGERKLDFFPSVPRPTRAASVRGWLTARWDQPDALAADDVAIAVLPSAPPRRVLLVTAGNWFLEKLLGADARVRFELLAPEAFQIGMAAQFDAVVLDRALPPGFDLATAQGNFIFLRDTPFAAREPAIEQPVATGIDAQHPALRLVNLEHVTFSRAAALALPPADDGWRWEAPLRAGEQPLMITGTRRTEQSGEQRLAAFAFDLADSDLPLRVAFPLLMGNTLHWLGGGAGAEARSIRAGETLALAPGESISATPETSADHAAPALPADAVRDSFVPLRNGFYRQQRAGGTEWIAVNTFAPAESDLRSIAPATASIPPAADHVFLRLPNWPVWQILALAALALLTLEWWLWHRRRTE